MATVVMTTCDMTEKDKPCGKPAVAEVTISTGKSSPMGLDLCEAHAQPLLAVASVRRTTKGSNKPSISYTEVWAWAAANPKAVTAAMGPDYSPPGRGRVPFKLQEAFEKAGN